MQEVKNLKDTIKSSDSLIQPPAKIKRFDVISETEKLPHPQPIHPAPAFQLIPPTQILSNFHINNFLTTPQPTTIGLNYFQNLELYQQLLNQMVQNKILLAPHTQSQFPNNNSSVYVTTGSHEEHDSGNETSSLSPGTCSPNSRSSRSSSFSQNPALMNAALAAMNAALTATPISSVAHFNPVPQIPGNPIVSNTTSSIDLTSQLMNAVFVGVKQENINNNNKFNPLTEENILSTSNQMDTNLNMTPKNLPKQQTPPQITKEIPTNDQKLSQTALNINLSSQDISKNLSNTTLNLNNTINTSTPFNNTNHLTALSSNNSSTSAALDIANFPGTSGSATLNNNNNSTLSAMTTKSISKLTTITQNNPSFPMPNNFSPSMSQFGTPQQSMPPFLSHHFVNSYLSGTHFPSSYTPVFYNYGNNNAQQQNFTIPNSQLLSLGDICDICNDRASGFHYGVMSCEGCKGFFRRSVQKSMKYECHKKGDCVVDRQQRNRCQSCRYQKCLSKGMIPGAVRSDKNRKRHQDEEKDADIRQTSVTLQLLHIIVEAFNSTFPPMKVFRNMIELTENLEAFLNKIPETAGISTKEKKLLVAYGTKPFLILRNVFCVENPEIIAEELQQIISSVTPDIFPGICDLDSIRAQITRYANGLSIEQIHREELAILAAIVLTKSICPGIEDIQSVKVFEKKLPLCLHNQMGLSNNNDYNYEYEKLFARLPQLFNGF